MKPIRRVQPNHDHRECQRWTGHHQVFLHHQPNRSHFAGRKWLWFRRGGSRSDPWHQRPDRLRSGKLRQHAGSRAGEPGYLRRGSCRPWTSSPASQKRVKKPTSRSCSRTLGAAPHGALLFFSDWRSVRWQGGAAPGSLPLPNRSRPHLADRFRNPTQSELR